MIYWKASIEIFPNTCVRHHGPPLFLSISNVCLFIFLTENEIDGSTLVELANDVEEFKAVLPKSGHRLRVKKVVKGNAGSTISSTSSTSSSTAISTEDEEDSVSL